VFNNSIGKLRNDPDLIFLSPDFLARILCDLDKWSRDVLKLPAIPDI